MNEPTRYLARCLDPVHIGAGGYRLGRVDMTIVREPSTGVPKIPGTSLAGAIRAYAEMAGEEDENLPGIAMVFGEASGNQGKQGMLRFYDAEIVLFPVISNQGTVWLSTAERIAGICPVSPPADESKAVAVKGLVGDKPVNLGWLMLETEHRTPAPVLKEIGLPFLTRVAVVSEKLFYHLVNDNLEVRTSVEIDDKTGAAKAGALFTYEAIPRGTVLGFEIAVDQRRGETTGVDKLLLRAFHGLRLLGIGGMGTRGFGRLEILNPNEGSQS